MKSQTQGKQSHRRREPEEEITYLTLLLTYWGYGLQIFFGHIREYVDLLLAFILPSLITPFEQPEPGYAPLIKRKEYFFARRLYGRIRDCWDRPIASAPGATIDVIQRSGEGSNHVMDASLQPTNNIKRNCLNLGSYNYLGFAQTSGPCVEAVINSVEKYGIASCGPRSETGSHDLHIELEKKFAEFIGKEDCMIFGMGYATNSTTIPALVSKGSLVLSDSLNHASIVVGCRSSGAVIRTFKHNDPEDLERVIKRSLIEGQPKTRRDWKKILIVVEGIYSMEGEIVRLPEIVAIKKKYKCYLYLDEAHSIGALGPKARGVCDYWGVKPADVDILMGTFTKSFGSVGGYISGNKDVIDYLRQSSYSPAYANSMPAGCVQQTLTALNIIDGKDGTNDGDDRITQLRENSNFFRNGLIKLGFQIVGDRDSPVIPLMLYHPVKIAEFSRLCLKSNIAAVVVGFPATTLIGSRARFCVSASHTKQDLADALEKIDEIGHLLDVHYSK